MNKQEHGSNLEPQDLNEIGLEDLNETPVEKESFSKFPISENVMKAMAEMGYTSPTPIQAQALPVLLRTETHEAQDFIGLASTGTGKTAAFGIPLVESIDETTKHTQGLVLSPTRELAMQVSEQLQKLGRHKGVRVATIYGGASYMTQSSALQRGAHIIVATPGRLIDFLSQKKISLQQVKTVVLDEADEMISMGFKDDLETILRATHPETAEAGSKASQRASCKTWLFSATMSREIRRVADTYLEKPVTVQINSQNALAANIEQIYYTVREGGKMELIRRLLQLHPEFYGIIFCQTKLEVVHMCDLLIKNGFSTDALHGDRSQKEREITLKKFRNREIQCIVATDVAARGLDIKDLTHVINHSLPWDTESYTHRIGRTGRNGQKGIAITLVNPDQIRALKRIQMQTKTVMKKGVIPTRRDVAALKTEYIVKSLMGVRPEWEKYKKALALIEATKVLSEQGDLEAGVALSSVNDLLARLIVNSHSHLLVEDEKDLDFMGDRVPKEMDSNSQDNYDRRSGPRNFRGSSNRSYGSGAGGGRRFEGGYGRRDEARGEKGRDSYFSKDRPARGERSMDAGSSRNAASVPAFVERKMKPAVDNQGSRPAFGDRPAKPAFERKAKPASEWSDTDTEPRFKERGPRVSSKDRFSANRKKTDSPFSRR